jgi:hypothetical protein
MRQALVDFIVWAWPVMPRYFKLWAFMNDGPLKPGVKTWWRP